MATQATKPAVVPPGTYYLLPAREQVAVGDDGRLEDVVIVPFKTRYGSTGSVSIPKADFTAEAVKAAVEEYVLEHVKLYGG